MTPEPAEFRQALGRFASGVTVVTALVDGQDHAMTASSFASVSLEPPLVLVCVEHDSRFHEAVMGATSFGVSVLTTAQRPAATWFATRGRPLVGQLDHVEHHRGPLGNALLTGALATLECTVVATHPGGDHTIVVGEVQTLEATPTDASALVIYRSGFHPLS